MQTMDSGIATGTGLTGRSATGLTMAATEMTGNTHPLQKQLNDVTEKRIDYLEKMQEKHMDIQAQLLSIHQPGVTSGDRIMAHPVIGNNKPKYHQAAVISKTILPDHREMIVHGDSEPTRPADEDRSRSPLDTPAPRRSAPLPTSYRKASPPQKTSHTPPRPTQHTPPRPTQHTPPKQQKSVGLLETILANAGETPKDHRSLTLLHQQGMSSNSSMSSLLTSSHHSPCSDIR
jgi:hypothetical protein